MISKVKLANHKPLSPDSVISGGVGVREKLFKDSKEKVLLILENLKK